jgi:hypothetical protein
MAIHARWKGMRVVVVHNHGNPCTLEMRVGGGGAWPWQSMHVHDSMSVGNNEFERYDSH